MKVAFFNHQLCIRGSTLSLYNYADQNEKILNNESIVVYMTDPENLPNTDSTVLEKFNKRFKTKGFNNWPDLDEYLREERVDVIFKSCGGWNDGKISKYAKTCVQAIFDIYEPHGDVYSYLHEYMSKKMSNGVSPVVHAICDYLPEPNECLKTRYNIPNDAKVFGRIGAHNCFNVGCAKEAIIDIVNSNKNIWFIFLGTDEFYQHPKIIYLPKSHDLQEKSNFINACDAMLHARIDGEVFSLSISEFLWFDKPIITYYIGNQTGHFEILKDKAIIYYDKESLISILTNFNKENYSKNLYKNIIIENGYTSQVVMKQFKQIYLDS
jgi:hypothetical protein